MSIVKQDIDLSRLGAHVKPTNGDRPKVDPQVVLLQTLDASIKELTKAVREIETAKIDLGPVASALRSVLSQVAELSKPKEIKPQKAVWDMVITNNQNGKQYKVRAERDIG